MLGPVWMPTKQSTCNSFTKQTIQMLQQSSLFDYKVRIIDSTDGTEAKTRVLIEFTDSTKNWSTIGVHKNIINASWNALCDGFNYYFMTS